MMLYKGIIKNKGEEKKKNNYCIKKTDNWNKLFEATNKLINNYIISTKNG